MFELDEGEFKFLRSQIVTSKTEGRGGSRYVPMMFTEQGVAMLSSVLNSKPAILDKHRDYAGIHPYKANALTIQISGLRYRR